MIFTINDVSIVDFIAEDGIRWTRNDIDSDDTGRTLDGVMHRGRIATKVRLDIKCKPLKSADVRTVLQAIKPEFVRVRYTDPEDGNVLRVMYSNNVPVLCATVYPDGDALWEGVEFPLIER